MQRMCAVLLLVAVFATYVDAEERQKFLLNPMKGFNHRYGGGSSIVSRAETPMSMPFLDIMTRLQREDPTESKQEKREEAPKPMPDAESIRRLFSGRAMTGNSRFGSKNCFLSAVQCSFHYSSLRK
uniref:Uncharacterized protein n=1 Tax=Plectus sambesii TaxID=2011161 RepID=A0A914VHZ9_9BILA